MWHNPHNTIYKNNTNTDVTFDKFQSTRFWPLNFVRSCLWNLTKFSEFCQNSLNFVQNSENFDKIQRILSNFRDMTLQNSEVKIWCSELCQKSHLCLSYFINCVLCGLCDMSGLSHRGWPRASKGIHLATSPTSTYYLASQAVLSNAIQATLSWSCQPSAASKAKQCHPRKAPKLPANESQGCP